MLSIFLTGWNPHFYSVAFEPIWDCHHSIAFLVSSLCELLSWLCVLMDGFHVLLLSRYSDLKWQIMSCSGCDDSRKSGLKYESTCIASCHQTLLHICLRSWRVRRVQFVLLNGKSLWTYSVCMALSDAKVPLAMVWSLLSYSDRRLRLWRSWKASTRRHAILFAFSNLKDRKGALTFGEWWPMMAFSGMIGQWMFP